METNVTRDSNGNAVTDNAVTGNTVNTANTVTGNTVNTANTVTGNTVNAANTVTVQPVAKTYRTLNSILESAAYDTMASFPDLMHAEPEEVENVFLDMARNALVMENSMRGTGDKFKYPQCIPNSIIALFMMNMYYIVKLSFNGKQESDSCFLSIYQEDGEGEGTYTWSDDVFYKIIMRFNHTITVKGMEEVKRILAIKAPLMYPCEDRDLVAVGNGLFNYATKELLPFTPDKIFYTKSPINYNENATNVLIHNDEDGTDWSPEIFFEDMSDDPGVRKLLWQIVSATLRTNVNFKKSAWLYSSSGCNAKGTFIEMLRGLLGEDNTASIPLSEMSSEFKLATLLTATSNLVDENDVGTYIDKCANLKAMITKDVITINRKYKQPVTYRFRGFMVQCLNEMPRIKDKSDSFFRRQIFIPFTKCFTGSEREYIKEDYIKRKDVLEYILYKALNTNFYTFDIPEVCQNALEEYKEYVDPVRSFCEEILPQCTWSLLPFSFLYDLYVSWSHRTNPNGTVQGRNTFINDVLNVIKNSDTWECEDKRKKVNTGDKMDNPEPLIAEYDLTKWMNRLYHGPSLTRLCSPTVSDSYRGLVRKGK